MTTIPANSGKPWTDEECKKLKALVHQKLSTPEIAKRMHRSESSIRMAASGKCNVTLNPKDKSKKG